MPLFTWNNEYSVGVGSMDSHHKKLFEIINRLHDAMKDGQAEGNIGALVKELADYTHYHFSEEEKLMDQIQYAGKAAQLREHDAFREKMQEFVAKVNGGKALSSVAEISDTAVRWLREHILGMDKKYEASMKAKGIK